MKNKLFWWSYQLNDLLALFALGGQCAHCCGMSSSQRKPSERHGYWGRFCDRGNHLSGVRAQDSEGIAEQAWAIREGLAERPSRR